MPECMIWVIPSVFALWIGWMIGYALVKQHEQDERDMHVRRDAFRIED